MKLSHLKQFLDHPHTNTVFLNSIRDELKTFENGHQSDSRVCPIICTQDLSFTVTTTHLINLCHHFLSDHITQWHLYYFADALELSEFVSFESEEIQEYFFFFSDPVVNGIADKEKINYILQLIL